MTAPKKSAKPKSKSKAHDGSRPELRVVDGSGETSPGYTLRKSASGARLGTIDNVVTVLVHHPEWRDVLAYDEFAECVVLVKPPPWRNEESPGEIKTGPWTDTDNGRAATWFGRAMRMTVTAQTIEQSIAVVAEKNKIHPVRDWLHSLKWDRHKRLDMWLTRYAGVPDTPYSRGIGALWLIGAVARVMRPGCQCDYALVFEGEQGVSKSSLLRALAPDPQWFSETPISLEDKDGMMALRSIWILSLDELDSVRRAEKTRTKNFITRTHDRYRPSYARRTKNYPRQCVFCGTTNEDFYLSDVTGNRRYWSVRVDKIDVRALERDRDQIWGEAYYRYTKGEQWHPGVELERLCAAEQAERVLPDDWLVPITRWCKENDDGDGVQTYDVLTGALSLDASKIVKERDTPRCAAVLRQLGYTRDRFRDDAHKQQWKYVLPPSRAAEQRALYAAQKAKKAKNAAKIRRALSPAIGQNGKGGKNAR